MRAWRWRRLLTAITAARSARVKCFDHELARGPLLSRADAGYQVVGTAEVVGSVGRWRELRPDFFYRSPFRSRERFERIGDAMRRGVLLPPLELYKLTLCQQGGAGQARSEFYVLDGRHRVAMARRLGQAFLDAHVVEYKVAAPAPAPGAPPRGEAWPAPTALAPRTDFLVPLVVALPPFRPWWHDARAAGCAAIRKGGCMRGAIWTRLAMALGCACSLLYGVVGNAAPASAAGQAPVLAVYYAWYGLGSWDANKMSDLPPTLYNSGDPSVIQQQVAEAGSAGIDAFEVDWYGPTADGVDHNMQTLLSVAHGANFQVTAYVDLNLIAGESDLIADLQYLRRYYDDPAWFHFAGKPFVNFYNVNKYSVAQWRDIFAQVDPNHQVFWMGEGVQMEYLSVFDGMHPFSIAWADNPAAQLAKLASWVRAVPGKAWMATVMPGNDDTHLGRADGFKVDRQDGAYYSQVWQGAIATKPDLINITSWNEWFEGHQIEPSRTYGDRYLRLTKQWSDAYRASMGAPATPPSSAAPLAPAANCRFVLGFATMAAALPAQVGQCRDDEGHNPANGDALQHTTGGLLVWRKADNWTAFTDGYHTWVNGPNGIRERLNTQRFSWEANPDGLPVVG